jgi:hypothetical protein
MRCCDSEPPRRISRCRSTRNRLVEDATTPTIDEVLDRAGGRAGGQVSIATAIEIIRDDRDRR